MMQGIARRFAQLMINKGKCRKFGMFFCQPDRMGKLDSHGRYCVKYELLDK